MRPARWLPWLFLLRAGGAQAAPLACGDFLSRLGQKPPYLVYEGCQQNWERQDQPFEARYAVDGKHARQAEAYLRRAYGLPRLQRYCCMWDSTRHSWRDRRTGYAYAMFMATGETLVRTRADWPRIERFVIQVDAYAHDPLTAKNRPCDAAGGLIADKNRLTWRPCGGAGNPSGPGRPAAWHRFPVPARQP